MILSQGKSQVIINGKVVDDSGFMANYDGKEMNLGLVEMGKEPIHIQMTNNELKELVLLMESRGGSSLEKRLKGDFKKKTRRKKSKHKKTRKKSRRR